MATYKIPAQDLSLNFPEEGTIFRAKGDMGAVYIIKNGVPQVHTASQTVAATDLYGPNGQIIKAGEPYPNSPSFTTRPVDPSYRGPHGNVTTGSAAYGSGFNSLPEYNMADIQSVMNQTGGKLPSQSVTQTNDPNNPNYPVLTGADGKRLNGPAPAAQPGAMDPTGNLNNPNANWQSNVQGPPPVTNPNSGFQNNVQGPGPVAGAAPTGTPGTPGTSGNVTGTGGSPVNAGMQSTNPALQQLLSNPNLTDDMRAAINAIYGAISANDTAKADQIMKAMETATKFSDPYFKAQIRMATDALQRGMNSIDGDLEYKQTSLQNLLSDLQRDIASAKGYLSFQEEKELKALERNYAVQLENTREDMASRGFTSSTIRSDKEALLEDTYGDLRESSQRSFYEKQNSLNNQLTGAQRNTQLELARLQQLAQQGKLDLLRDAEGLLGTQNLQAAGYNQNLLGGIGGEIPRAQVNDALNFAQGFVF